MKVITEQDFELYYQIVMKYCDEVFAYFNAKYNVAISDYQSLQNLLSFIYLKQNILASILTIKVLVD